MLGKWVGKGRDQLSKPVCHLPMSFLFKSRQKSPQELAHAIKESIARLDGQDKRKVPLLLLSSLTTLGVR